MTCESTLRACHCCGQIQQVASTEKVAQYCVRCSARIRNAVARHWSNDPSIAFAMAALILYFPAILLPILRIERFGYRHISSLLSGTWELMLEGNWFVGLIVLIFSIILPLCKIIGVLELTLLRFSKRHHRGWVYRLVEFTGRWGMLDVLLLALLVMLVKVGDLVHFEFGPAIVVFVLCVSCNMLASLFFDPQAIWLHDQIDEVHTSPSRLK